MSFNNFVHNYNSKTKVTSKIKFQNILSSLSLSDLGTFLCDSPIESDAVIKNLNLTKGTLCVAYINLKYSDAYGCSPPQKLSKSFIKPNSNY